MGGAFDGRLCVYAGEARGQVARPIQDVSVRVEWAGGSLDALTDASGCAFFEGSELAPPFDVHVFAEDRPFESELGVEAKNLTVLLDALEGEGTGAAFTRVVGSVDGFEVLPPVSEDQSRLGYVQQLFASPVTAGLAQRPRAGTAGLDLNEVLEDPNQTLTTYRYDAVDFFSEGLYVVAGSLDTRLFRNEFTPTHTGYIDGLDFTGGDGERDRL